MSAIGMFRQLSPMPRPLARPLAVGRPTVSQFAVGIGFIPWCVRMLSYCLVQKSPIRSTSPPFLAM